MLMEYAQQIEVCKLTEMTTDGKKPRYDESSKPKAKKRFYNRDSSIGNRDMVFN